MKNIYICGDSFAVSDPEFGPCWVDFLSETLGNNCHVINLSRVCASNLQIGLQIDHAIQNKADYVIYLMTTSTRFDVSYNKSLDTNNNLLSRYVNITNKEPGYDLTSYSLNSLDNTTIFNSNQLLILKNYHNEFSDLSLLIYQSEILIEGILSRLIQNNIKFCYDQGGFENINFDHYSNKIYFNHYQNNKSIVNLWNFARHIRYRPFYHITDRQIHKEVADYYAKRLAKELNMQYNKKL